MISIIIPTHKFPNSDFYLNRCLNSIREQTYQDYEIIIKDKGKGIGDKLNQGIKEAKGGLIKILFTDDYLSDKNALKRIVDAHKGFWSVTSCVHDNGVLFNQHIPSWNDNVVLGINTIGSPSVLVLTKGDNLPKWDENMQWLVDCDYYQKLYELYGEPNIIHSIEVVIGIHDNQLTNTLEDEIKRNEFEYVKNRIA